MPAPTSASRRSIWLESPPRPPVPLVMMTKSGLSAMMASRFTAVKSPTVATSGLWMVQPAAVSASSETPTSVPPASSQAFAKLPMQATTRWGLSTVTSLPISSVKVTGPGAVASAAGASGACCSCWVASAAGASLSCWPHPANTNANAAAAAHSTNFFKTKSFLYKNSLVRPRKSARVRQVPGIGPPLGQAAFVPRRAQNKGQGQVPVGTAASGRSFGNGRMNVKLLAMGAVVVLGQDVAVVVVGGAGAAAAAAVLVVARPAGAGVGLGA